MNIAKFFRNLAGIIALASLTSLSALAQTAAPQGVASKPGTIKSTAGAGHLHTAAIPEIRVIGKVDISRRTLLRGHVPSVLRAAKDLGRLAPSTPAQHMVMVLKSSDAQEAALRRVLDEQQDRKTANYHQWVTPDQFGAHFGVHDADIAKVSAWLKSQGFNVEDVSKSKRVIHFSGTTGNLESAFHTEIHSYNLNGETHASNNSDISVPSALSPVIAGVSMHNFFRKSNMGPVRRLSELKAGPNYTSSGGTSYVGPGDFATIYNTQPLLAAGINGAGTSIAVVGRSDILMSDVQSYRQLFNLPLNDPIFIHAGQDNGTQPGDDGESDLDVEISGGIAPQAKVYFVIGTPTFLVDGITNSVEYIVENNLADIMSISYGSCEAVEGAGGNAFNNQAIEQAAAQGISTFVASGDNGPAECDSSSSSYETLGYATGGESSTPYTVSVGGSEFYEHGGTGYWSTNANMNPLYKSSALSYIPETPWNEAKGADVTSTASGSLSGLWSDSGGISAYYLQPSWQRGPGVPTSDPTLLGGNWITGYTITNAGSAYTAAPSVTFTGGGCVTEPTATSTISGGSVTAIVVTSGKFGFGCTSAPTVTLGAPTGTGTKVTATATVTIGPMQDPAPLISGVPHRYTPDLSLNAASGHDGTLFCSEGVCEISPTGAMLDAGIVGGTSVAAPSMAGIQALIDQANGGRQGAPNYIYYALAAAQSTANCNSSLPPAVGSQCAFQDITVGDNLICGTSSCSATNGKIGFQAGVGYDMASGLGSVDAYNLSNLWSTVVFNSSTTTLGLSQTTAIAQGSPITFTGNVSAGSGTGTPTGDVAFILSQGEFGQAVDVNSGAWDNPSPFATLDGNGNYTATLSNLPAGNFTVTARYGGDVNFASSLSAPVAVAVSTGNSQVVITPEWFNDTVTCTLANVTSYNYGQFAWIPATVTSTTGQGVPTGTVTFTVDGVTYGTETLDPNGSGYLAAGTLATNSCIYDYLFAQSPTLPAGVHVIGASYSGDSTFAPATATPVTITVNQLSVTPTLSVGAQNITSGFTVPLVATFTTTALTGTSSQSSGPTGTVTFMDGATTLATATVVPTVTYSAPTYTFAATAVGSTTGIVAPPTGAHSITAVYSGDTNYAAKTSNAATVTVDVTAPVATTTTVTSSANPTTLGGRPTFTATIAAASGTAPASGTVTFYDGGALLGTGAVGSTHTATFRPGTTPAFRGGAHTITAVYGGIAANGPSTSAPFTENVTQGTATITLTAKTVGTASQTYTFAAVLSPSSTSQAYAPILSNVQFYDGATNIGSALAGTVTSAQGGYALWTATLSVNNLTTGSHTITAKYSDTNYSLTTSNAQTVFVAGKPTITWATPAAILAGTALSATQLNATDNIPGTFVYTPAAGTVLTAGTHNLSVTFTPADLADFSTQTKVVPIQVIAPAITWKTPAAISYGTALTAAQLNATANYAGAFTYTPALGTILSAGSQTLSVSFLPTGATTPVVKTVTLQVNTVPLTINVDSKSFTYGGTLPAFTGTVSGLINGDTVGTTITVTYSSTGSATSGAGTYPITAAVTGASSGDYTLTDNAGTLTINKASLTIAENPASGTYGNALPTLSGVVSGNVNGDTVGTTLAVTYSTTASSSSPYSDAGTYPITAAVTGASAGNYNVTDNGGTLTINRANLTLTVNNATGTYGSALPTFTSALGGLTNGDTSTNAKGGVHGLIAKNGRHLYGGVAGDLTITYSTTARSTSPYSPVSTYPITAVLGGAGAVNYNVTVNTPGVLSITPATLTIAENPASGTYGNALPTLSGVVSGTVNGDTVGTTLAVAYSTTASSSSPYSDAGNYPITASVTGTSSGNYTVTDNGGTLTINAASLTITVNNASGTYGSALPTFTSTLSGLTNGDSSTNAKGGVHGLAVRNVKHRNGGLSGDLTIDYSTTANSSSPYSPVGTYPITATLSGAGASNYTVAGTTPGTLTINKATLTIAENAASGTYGNALPALSGVVSGNVNGDTVGTTLAVTYSTTASSSSPYSDAGTYPITAAVTGTSATNYNVTDNGGTLTINPASLTITVNNASGTYGSALPTFTSTLGGLTNGDSSTNAIGGARGFAVRNVKHRNGGLSGDLTITYSTTARSTSPYSPVSTYPITAVLGGAGAANYNVTVNTPGILSITPATLTIAENPASGTYGGALPTLSGVVSGTVNGDAVGTTLAVAYSTTASSSSPYSDAGTYPITASVTGTSSGNYTVTDNGGTLTINPANISIAVNDASGTYGSALPTFSSVLTGLTNGDSSTNAKGGVHGLAVKNTKHRNGGLSGDLTINYSTTANSSSPYSPIGTYPITATLGGAGASNYTVTGTTPGTLTINKASLTIAENPASGTYGSALPTLSGVVSGNVNGDTVGTTLAVTYSTTASSTSPYSDASTYPITAAVTGTSAGNYTVTDNGGTLTINPASLTITVNNATGVYGNALPTFTSRLSGLTNGDSSTNAIGGARGFAVRNVKHRNGGLSGDLTINYSTTASSTSPYSPVATYPITATLSGAGAGNYTPTTVAGTLSITPATLTVTAANKTVADGFPLPAFTYSIGGFVNGDSAASAVSGAPSLTTTAVQGSLAGTYPITPAIGGLAAANYSFAFTNGTLTITPAPVVGFSTTSISFGNQLINTASTAQQITLTNTGSATLTFNGTLTGANAAMFSKWSTCAGPLASGMSCVVNIVFTPTATGPATAALTMTDNAYGSPHTVVLSGTGTAPAVTLSQSSLSFGNQNVNTTSAAQQVTITNSGTSTLTYTGTLTGTNASMFSKWSNCTGSLAPSASCTVNIQFTPTATGAATAALTLTDNAAGSPHVVNLSGTGIAPVVTLSQTSLSFGNQLINTAATAQSVKLTNSGTAALTYSFALTGAGASAYSQTSNCTGTLAAGANCTISVVFKPTVTGSLPAALTFTDNAAGSPHSVALSGTGIAPAVTLSKTSLSFGNQQINTISATQTVTLTNSGTSTLTFNGTLTGANPAAFVKWSTCVGSLAPSTSCTVSFVFAPTVTGSATAALTIVDNASGSPHSIALSGTGINQP